MYPSLFYSLSLNSMPFNRFVNTSQTGKDPEKKKAECRCVHKPEVIPYVSYCPTDGPNSTLLVTEVSVAFKFYQQ